MSWGDSIHPDSDLCHEKEILLTKAIVLEEKVNELIFKPLRSLTTKEWLSTREAAAYLSLSRQSLQNMASNGLVPYYKLGKRNRFRVDDLRNLLLENKRGV